MFDIRKADKTLSLLTASVGEFQTLTNAMRRCMCVTRLYIRGVGTSSEVQYVNVMPQHGSGMTSADVQVSVTPATLTILTVTS